MCFYFDVSCGVTDFRALGRPSLARARDFAPLAGCVQGTTGPIYAHRITRGLVLAYCLLSRTRIWMSRWTRGHLCVPEPTTDSYTLASCKSNRGAREAGSRTKSGSGRAGVSDIGPGCWGGLKHA